MRTVFLAGGIEMIVDERDFEFASSRNWSLSTYGYAKCGWHGKTIYMHQLVLIVPEGMVIDHVNRNTLDNRRHNLRVATIRDNSRNRRMRRPTQSGFKGVRDVKNGRFQGRIKVDGKLLNLGMYDTPEEAHVAYLQAAKQIFGEFACP